MDLVKAQEDLIAAMKSWQDVTLAPDDPNQPHTFQQAQQQYNCLLYTSPSPRDQRGSASGAWG